MLKAYKYRLYPTKEQAELINKHIDACRLVYNLALETKKYAYVAHGKHLSSFDLMKQLPGLKEIAPWLKKVDSQALQQSISNLDNAFCNFFKGNSYFPRFKNKYSSRSFRNAHGDWVKIKDGKLFQPKFRKGIKIVIDRAFSGIIKSTTISRTPTDKYFVSILVENDASIPKLAPITEHTAIGIDLGISSFIVTSEGIKIDNPKHHKNTINSLNYLQRQLSKKQPKGCNKRKLQRKIALKYEKITNQKNDFLHKLSTSLINNHDTLCFESLKINNMIKNRKLSQAIHNAGWGLFVEMCKYKANWGGKNILQIPTFQASTKICSTCGNLNDSLTLSDREWECMCGVYHDRDINAAINIRNYALNNCGKHSRKKPVEPPALVGAMKQENM